MTIEKLKRVLWRLEEQNPEYQQTNRYSEKQLRRAIMFECGIDERTIIQNIKRLKELGWLKQRTRFGYTLTQEHQNY